MNMFKKLVSIVAAAALLTSSMAFTFSAGAASVDPTDEVSADAHLQANVQDGVVLHAFNWSYNAIKEALPSIAAAGYSTVQTSPVQQPKDYTPSTDVAGQWWKLYQPVSMSIAKNSWLGTKAELTSLCAEADKYGIKIIVDIVSNHMGSKVKTDANSLSDDIKTYEPTMYNNKSTYFRNNSLQPDDNNVQKIVQGHLNGCPDLNTNNTQTQNKVVDLLKECIDCGVDGFRFDAAKHIETPSDGSYASQYWPTITNAAKNYYTQKNPGKSLYIYGEILNTPGSGRSYSHYTQYINAFTDNKTGDRTLAAVNGKNASSAAASSYISGQSAKNLMIWAESHDTFEGESGINIKNTSGISDEVIAKTWAMVASRKDASALYFARPGNARMGEASTDATYKSTAVAEVNKFHNLFVGQSEKLGSSGSYAYVQRGGKGIVIVNCSGGAANASVSGTGMANGTYTDMVTGANFTVSNGTVTGRIGSSGIAVVYAGKTTPRATSSVESGNFKGETLTVKLGLENAASGTYCLDDSTPVSFTDGMAIKIGSDYNYNETITLTLTATGSDGTKETNVYKYKKLQNDGSGVYIWLNPAKKTTWKGPFNVWVYDEETYGKSKTYTNAPAWPGEAMTYDATQKLYYYEIPKTSYLNGELTDFDLSKSAKTAYIINATDITTNQTAQFPAANSSGIAKPQYLNGKSWEYAMTSGTSITQSTRTPTVVDIPATVATKGQGEVPTDAPTTQKPTEAPTTAKPTAAPTTEPVETDPPVPEDVYVIAGSNNFLATGWSADPDSNVMTKQADGTYAVTIENVENDGGLYQVKVVRFVEGDIQKAEWYGYDGTSLNYDFMLKGDGNVTVTFNPTNQQIKVTGPTVTDPVYDLQTIHAVGAGQNGFLDDESWATNANVMEEVAKDVYEISYEDVDANTEYQFKFLANGTWDINWGSIEDEDKAPNKVRVAQYNSAGNIFFTTDSESETVDITLRLDLSNWDPISKGGATYKITVVPHSEEQPTQAPTTVKPTDPQPTTAPSGDTKYYYGDVNFDGIVDVTDATLVQLHVSQDPKYQLTGLALTLADCNADGVVDVTDATLIQLYSGDQKDKSKDAGKPYYLPVPTQPTTQPQPTTQQPTTQKPTTGKSLTVTAKSNIFPQATTTFDPIADKITVTYWIDLEDDPMLNGQWTMYYDNTVLSYDTEPGVNQIYDNTGKKIRKALTFRVTDGNATVLNPNPASIPTGGIKCNAADLNGFDLCAEDGGRVPFVSVTFTPKDGAEGNTEVYLDVEYMQLGEAQGKYYFVEDSVIVKNDIKYLPTDTATAVYAGTFNANVQQKSSGDPVPATQRPTSEPAPTEIITSIVTNPPTTEPTETPTQQPYTEPTEEPTQEPYTEPTEEPTQEPYTDPIFEGGSFKFTDNQNWGTVYVYAFDDNGAVGAEWPGTACTDSELNGYNENVFTISVPAGATGVVLNDGIGEGGQQTVNITNFDVEGYYTKAGDTDELGHLNVYVWGDDPGPGPGPNPGGSFKFTDNQNWGTVYVYAYGENGDLTSAWPGDVCSDSEINGYNETVFTITVPEGAQGVVLSNGDGAQTTDITDFTVEGYYTDGSKDGEGKFIAIPWPGGDVPGPGPNPGGSFKFTDNQGWGTVYVYAYGENGDLTSAWPGDVCTESSTNDLGETVFTVNVPAGAQGVVMSNGNGAQTTDITDFSAEGYYTDGSKDGEGKFIAIPWPGGDIPEPNPGDGGSFKFTDNQGWGTVYVYAYGENGDLTSAWPGDVCTESSTNDLGETVFTVYVPAGAQGVVLSNGNGAQTTDITDFSAEGYYTDGSKDGEGKFIAIPWPGGDIPGPGPNPGGDGGSFKFTDNQGWGTVYVYAYGADGDLTSAWPGDVCTESSTNDLGETVFTVYVPAGAQGVVLSNGNGAQTTDITDFSAEGYYTDGNKDGEGKFIAIPWPGGDIPGPGPNPGGDGSSFKFTDNQGWGTVYVYAYGADGDLTSAWPGDVCTDSSTNDLGETVFTVYVPAGAQGVVLSNGNGAQTTDITDFSAEGYYTDGNKDGEGKFIAVPWPGSLPGGGDEPYNPPSGDGSSFKFTDNQGWGTVYVYAYGADGDLTSAWPGDVCTDSSTNDLGETVFTVYVPAGAQGVVLSNGNGAQTTDITDFSAEGYYTDGNKDGEGKFIAVPWPGSLPSGGDEPYNPPSGNASTFLFTNNAGWGLCFVYAFNENGDVGAAWPGNTMAEKTTNGYGEEQFIINVPAGATGIVLNNGNGDQTVNITDFGVAGYYTTGNRDGSGHLNVYSWT